MSKTPGGEGACGGNGEGERGLPMGALPISHCLLPIGEGGTEGQAATER